MGNMQHKWVHNAFFALSIILFLYMCAIGINNIFRYNAFRTEFEEQRRLLLLETHTNQVYKHQLSRVEDPGFWELEAKTRLGYVNPGEVVYKVIPKESKRK